jgi:hypothetical protein
MTKRAAPSQSRKTVFDLRRENLTRLLDGPGRKTQLAVRLGVSQARISHLLKGGGGPHSRRITTDQARDLESIFGLPAGALDLDPARPEPSRGGAPDKALLLASVRAVTLAATDLGIPLAPDVAADLVSTVADLSKPGAILEQPVVKAMVALATRAPG